MRNAAKTIASIALTTVVTIVASVATSAASSSVASAATASADAVLGFSDIAGKPRLEVREDAPCCVTGVVTFASPAVALSGVLAARDDISGNAIWFSGEINNECVAELSGATNLVAGMAVEVSGVISRLGFAPGIKAERITVLEPPPAEPLPAAPVRRLRELGWGVMDNRRVSLHGILVEAAEGAKGFAALTLSTQDGDFTAHVPGTPQDWRRDIDAELALCGVATSSFNIRGEFIGVCLEVVDAREASIAKPAPPVEGIREVTPGAVMPYSSVAPDLHRRRVRGTVTCAKDAEAVYIQSGESALRVKTHSTPFSPGDEVEALGFPRMEDGLGCLAFAEVRRIGRGVPPAPVRVTWRELEGYPVRDDGTFENFDARLAVFDATLASIDDNELLLSVGEAKVKVSLEGEVPQEIAECAAVHPTVRITGVLSLVAASAPPHEALPRIVGWRVDACRCEGAVALVRDATWRAWRQRRFAVRIGIGVLCAIALLALLFLSHHVRMKGEMRRLDIVEEERKRMAGDLHDTVEQNLVAAKMLLNTAVSLSPETSHEVKSAIESAQEILMSAKAEIRETVFNLRNDEFFGIPPEEAIRKFVERLRSRRIVRVRSALRGLPRTIPAPALSDILFIVQEAVTNAVKHGGATTVFIVSDPAPNSFTLRILNDGSPFDAGRALGPEAGHFGIAGMRERARRSDFGISVGMENGMTCVRLEVKK